MATATCGGSSQTATCTGTLTVGSSSSSGDGSTTGSFTDTRDNQTYNTVTIGSQTWMAENLNYNESSDSKCHSNNESTCTTYGRLYKWVTAMALPANCETTSCSSEISPKHRGICPAGWHIPSSSDWDVLIEYVHAAYGQTYSGDYSSTTAGKYLKATSGWNNYIDQNSWNSAVRSGNGEDKYGFTALPGGHGDPDGSFYGVGNHGFWWSTSEGSSSGVSCRSMRYNDEYVGVNNVVKSRLYSVRCIQN
jgi:uncharacterized protein (TIGR02145 family)